jgi:hypothetical protein
MPGDGEGPHLACGSRACQLPLLLGHRLCSDADEYVHVG